MFTSDSSPQAAANVASIGEVEVIDPYQLMIIGCGDQQVEQNPQMRVGVGKSLMIDREISWVSGNARKE